MLFLHDIFIENIVSDYIFKTEMRIAFVLVFKIIQSLFTYLKIPLKCNILFNVLTFDDFFYTVIFGEVNVYIFFANEKYTNL